MKKLGLLFFISALVIGSIIANVTSIGHFSIGETFFSKVTGSGIKAFEKRDVADFTSVKGSGAIAVEISAQKDFSVEVEADDNLLEFVKTEIDGNTLEIYTEGNISRRNPIIVKIGMPTVDGISISGASKAIVRDVKGEELSLKANGASKIIVNGEVTNLSAGINGASNIEAQELKTENTAIKANGASSATVFTVGSLRVKANGASRINYIGEPTNIEKKTNGGSSVQPREQ